MAREITVRSWEEFEVKIIKLQTAQKTDHRYQRMLFRGQQDSTWPLSTTLERDGKVSMEFSEYYRVIAALQPQIETLTQNQWNIPDYVKVEKLTGKYDEFSRTMTFGETPAYGYMAHLRHHGFPSPLLDWTRSAYVAAFFAFNRNVESEFASIYILFEASMQTGSSNEPKVVSLGPYVKTHRRHYLQQSEYTMCLLYGDRWLFTHHDIVLQDWDDNETAPCNFFIHKINIPRTERMKVLKILDSYNLNAYSLFGSEESLMETLALRELHFEDE